MMDTSLKVKPHADDDEVYLRKKASHGAYREFRLAKELADMTDKEALDQAFKLFAAAVRHEIDKAGNAA